MRSQIETTGHAVLEEFVAAEALDAVAAALAPQFQRHGQADHVELNRPSRGSAELQRSPVRNVCRTLAEAYFGTACYCLYEHAIQKAPNSAAITAWHQDQAYLGAHLRIPSLNFWIPLADVNEASGTLCFMPSAVRELLPHRRELVGGIEQLRIVDLAPMAPVAVTVQRGGASVHTELTVHASFANRSSQPRQAWVLHYSPVSPVRKRLHQITRGVFLSGRN